MNFRIHKIMELLVHQIAPICQKLSICGACLVWGYVAENDPVERNYAEWIIFPPRKNYNMRESVG
jgi:hypothetical protein